MSLRKQIKILKEKSFFYTTIRKFYIKILNRFDFPQHELSEGNHYLFDYLPKSGKDDFFQIEELDCNK